MPACTGTYSSLISSATTRMRERAGLVLLYLGLAWNAEHTVSHARQPVHLSTSIRISFTIFAA